MGRETKHTLVGKFGRGSWAFTISGVRQQGTMTGRLLSVEAGLFSIQPIDSENGDNRGGIVTFTPRDLSGWLWRDSWHQFAAVINETRGTIVSSY